MREREEIVNDIIQEIEEEVKWQDEYYIENEDSPIAAYVGSFCYGEIDPSQLTLDRFEDERTEPRLKSLMQRLSQSDLYYELDNHTELRSVGIYYETAELYGATVGECEYQLDRGDRDRLSELCNEVENKFTDDEFEKIERYTGFRFRDFVEHGSGFGYCGDDYARWVLVLDEESFNDWYESECPDETPEQTKLGGMSPEDRRKMFRVVC